MSLKKIRYLNLEYAFLPGTGLVHWFLSLGMKLNLKHLPCKPSLGFRIEDLQNFNLEQ